MSSDVKRSGMTQGGATFTGMSVSGGGTYYRESLEYSDATSRYNNNQGYEGVERGGTIDSQRYPKAWE